MNPDFWKSRWNNNQTGWHMEQVHPRLVEYWPVLNLSEDSTVLVPLCGKSLDLHWLARRHRKTIGVEVVEQPVRELMEQQSAGYETKQEGPFTIYRSGSLEIWNGDFFSFPSRAANPLHGIYDRGSLVSFPYEDRRRYARHLLQLCSPETQILLITFNYPQEEMEGPPYSISREEIQEFFGHRFHIELLAEESLLAQMDALRRRGLSSYMYRHVYHLYSGE